MSTFSSPKPAPSTESILPCYPQPNTHTHHIQIHRKKSIRSISAVVPISNLSRLKFADLKIFQGRKVRLCFIYEQLRGRCRANGEGFQHLAAKESGRGWGSRRKSEGWHGNLRKEDTDKGHEVRGGSEGDSRAAFPFTLAGESSIRSNASHTSLPKDTVTGISQDSDEEALCSLPAANRLHMDYCSAFEGYNNKNVHSMTAKKYNCTTEISNTEWAY